MNKAIKILSIICIITSSCWIGFMLWDHFTLGSDYEFSTDGYSSHTKWSIRPSNTESIIKFYAVLIPSLVLGILTFKSKSISGSTETEELELKNKILRQKIEQKELEAKLKNK